jgi:hypothetical protein
LSNIELLTDKELLSLTKRKELPSILIFMAPPDMTSGKTAPMELTVFDFSITVDDLPPEEDNKGLLASHCLMFSRAR